MPPPFVRPFHFWCQKVLPLVFDDSLSYYEVLAKMRDCLNEAIKEIIDIGGEFDGVKTQLTELRTYVDEYFAGLDVNQAISDKLDNMVESGEMDAVITPIFAAYANPLFAASVADMMATNFAYANYENNKIYTFNQSTGLYQTTGKEFGGVVSSVDEMEDNDKYYALDSDGMLYSYDFPQSAFVATGLTYGGYRYGVNAMRPIANTYVLTTDSHLYTWNGNEYVDTGVVYGLSNTAFIWRRKLTSADNVTALIVDGWYYFALNSLPQGLPSNMESSDGFIVVYSITDDTENSDNVQTENAQNAETQWNQTIVANSRNKRIALKTAIGGSWFWNGNTWFSENEIGFPVCANCNAVDWNSVLQCDSNTTNTPNNESGLVKTFAIASTKAQVFFASNSVWFRIGNTEWNQLTVEQETQYLEQRLRALEELTTTAISQNSEEHAQLNAKILALDVSVNERLSVITEKKTATLQCENSDFLCCENNALIDVTVFVQLTDKTLTQHDVSADAYVVGEKINECNANIESEANLRENNDNSLQTLLSNESEARVLADDEITAQFHDLANALSAISQYEMSCENGDTLMTENNLIINGSVRTPITDKTLTKENVPADSFTTGQKINEVSDAITQAIQEQAIVNENATNSIDAIQYALSHVTTTKINIIVAENDNALQTESNNQLIDMTVGLKDFDANDYSHVWGAGYSGYLTIVSLYGSLPTTKTNVNMSCIINYNGAIIYSGDCKVKVQGSSSVQNPEKNFTITFPRDVTIYGFTTHKWNIKANYIDTTQIRNLICADIWYKLNSDIRAEISTRTILAQNGDTVVTENDNEISSVRPTNPVTNAPYFGASYGELCAVTCNDEFYGLCSLQLSKDKYMFNCTKNSHWVIGVSGHWNFEPLDGNFEDYLEVEVGDVDEQTAETKINAWLNSLYALSGDDLINTTLTDMRTIARYITFAQSIHHVDGVDKNINLVTYDNGNSFHICPWDMDCTFGNGWTPVLFQPPEQILSVANNHLLAYIASEIPDFVKAQYQQVKIFTRNNQMWYITTGKTNTVNETLYIEDFKKWGSKGKTLLHNPATIREWMNDYRHTIDSAYE